MQFQLQIKYSPDSQYENDETFDSLNFKSASYYAGKRQKEMEQFAHQDVQVRAVPIDKLKDLVQ
jgi:hypothetical protein